MEFIGYARVSTREQNLDLQLDALKSVGCERIFMEKASGVKERPELDKALSYLRAGDTFVIWKLDRLGRSLKELVSIVDGLQKRNIAFISISDGINTSSALGKCQFGIFAALAEYEREMIIERTKAGLQAARERGKLGGRPKGLSVEGKRKAKAAKILYLNGEYSINEICKMLKIGSKATLYRYLSFENVSINRRKK
ncbi:Resolvase domain (plasmid) [Phocaeicola salanitronis DSM 18170]|mgnify:CR=1 FL=1|uniref:Resolvase domain n=1 Tax=Phocaeicola salanitronis (strain DSM 18170 / JCM 13657 / CCUG 60908 / BL78) TaxID=667015 RepID=F0R9A4_PHOSB|nr:recombinase family protein [Phocaeicola salanitronis]ADY38225.1 Resolvase domain [Phocaeicola salanitronis DSM 18170]